MIFLCGCENRIFPSSLNFCKVVVLFIFRTSIASSPQRRLAPEERTADAEARAAALDVAAVAFREGGFEARATELEEEAAAIRKKDGQALPPGRRLDAAAGYAKRAAARAAKACDAVTSAEEALANAIKTRDAARAASEEAEAKLATLRA